jgi:hypothetical protein
MAQAPSDVGIGRGPVSVVEFEGETIMRTVRENTALLLAAVFTSRSIFKPIAEALYALSVRRSLRAIERFG